MTDPDDLRLLNVSQLAAKLGLERHTVSRMCRAGVFPAAFVDDRGRAWFSLATIRAAQERAGVLHAEDRGAA